LWDFDDGTKITGASVKHTFSKSGEYDIKLGVKLRSLTNGIIHNKGIMKKFTVFNTPQELTSYNAKRNPAGESVKDLRQYENARITINYSAENEFRKDALFRIEILSSKTRIGTGSNVFSNLQGKYFIKELLDSASGNYYYIADEQLYLMHAYPAFRELAGMGFKSIRLRMDVIHDPVGKELIKLKKNYGVLTDTYFDANNRLTANGYLLLDQIVILLNRNPGIRMEIAVHTDNQGVPANSLILSRMRAQTMVNYLINRGINSKRLIATGYGGSRPVASNNSTAERRLNRRIDITIE